MYNIAKSIITPIDMDRKILVSVLILNWNGKEHLEECLSSLTKGCSREDVEFVVVDNASNDGSVQFVKDTFSHDSRVKVLTLDKNYGWSGGNNRGMQKAIDKGSKYIFLLNNDTKVEQRCIEKLIEFSEEHPEAGAIAPKIILYDQPFLLNSIGLECSIIGSAWDRGIGRVDTPRWNKVEEVIGVCGAGMWLRSEALKITGLLPENFEIYLDDLDLCLRIWMNRYKILTCPDAMLYHKFSSTWKTSTDKEKRKYYLNTRNRFWLIERNFPKGKLPKIIFYLMYGEIKAIANSVRKGELWRISAHAKSWAEAVRYLPEAINTRRLNKQLGENVKEFWRLVKTFPLFCPEVKLPINGWYKDDIVNEFKAFPISKFAWLEHKKDSKLNITVYNFEPQIGEVDINIKTSDGNNFRVVTKHSETIRINNLLPGTKIEFEANRLFEAEITKKSYDIGGWIRVETI
ncbi:MAG: glycosyltransferase family 2 protein [Candidatus Hydrogenedentes bacterium]|nr:glycosyltransferase family 2 protein [Candidatus Hydrogenedentota bacterium]